MCRFGKVLQVFAASVLIHPVLIAGMTPNAHDATSFEVSGPRTAPLSPQAQEKLNQFKDALRDAREKGDAQSEAQALRLIGLLNYSNERFEDALEGLSSSLLLYRKLNAESLVATELCEMASAYTALGCTRKHWKPIKRHCLYGDG